MDTKKTSLSKRSPHTKDDSPDPKMPSRSAMGEYIVPTGGHPLTSLGDARPGPADYTLNTDVIKSSAPQYSIAGRYRSNQSGDGLPGPADYTPPGDLIWKERKATLNGRGKSYFDQEAAKIVTVMGPAKYNINYKLVGKDGPQHTIAQKQSSTVYTGPPNGIVQPVDTHGFQTPGPNYRPNSGYWKRGPEQSFGCARRTTYPNGPGPGDYTLSDSPRGPTHTFGSKLPPPPSVQRSVNKESPAPNTYNLGTSIGKATAVTLSGCRKEHYQAFQSPSPASYNLRDSMKHTKRAVPFAYRWLDTEEPNGPGPADYSITHKNLKKNPSYSHRNKTKPSFPDSLNYVAKSVGDFPGPGKYNLSKEFVRNDAPSFSMRQKVASEELNVPAPNAYLSEQHDIPGSRKAPSFSMGKRFDLPDNKNSPGPAAYTPSVQDSSPKYSMTSRQQIKGRVGNPAPGTYMLPSKFDGKTGVTLKSRASPYVYSGFRTTKIIEPDNSPAVRVHV